MAYDYQDIHRMVKFDRYDLIAVPRKVLVADEIPQMEVFNAIIPRFEFAFTGDISFAQMKEKEM